MIKQNITKEINKELTIKVATPIQVAYLLPDFSSFFFAKNPMKRPGTTEASMKMTSAKSIIL